MVISCFQRWISSCSISDYLLFQLLFNWPNFKFSTETCLTYFTGRYNKKDCRLPLYFWIYNFAHTNCFQLEAVEEDICTRCYTMKSNQDIWGYWVNFLKHSTIKATVYSFQTLFLNTTYRCCSLACFLIITCTVVLSQIYDTLTNKICLITYQC